MHYQYLVAAGAGIVLGLTFVASGVGKILESSEFLTVLTSIPFLSTKLSVVIAQWLPWVELALGLFLIVGISAKFTSSISFILVIGFIFQNSWLITHGLATDDCGCFGRFGNMLEMERQITLSSQNALYMDIGMVALILIILHCYPGKFFTLRLWFLR